MLRRSAIAINEEYIDFGFDSDMNATSGTKDDSHNIVLRNRDVVAIIPPVSGG